MKGKQTYPKRMSKQKKKEKRKPKEISLKQTKKMIKGGILEYQEERKKTKEKVKV